MFVPIIPNSTIVNKTIIYSDTILNIKDCGSNIKISSIDDVTEHELEKCLKIIFENNKDVLFNTIQYSKNKNKIYFYTDKEINTKVWEEFKVSTFKQLNYTKILNEIKNILEQEINKDEDCISLYDVSCLMKQIEREYNSLKNHFLSNKENDFEYVIIYGFDYNTNELKIGIKSLCDIYEISFTKQDGDLFITKSEYYNNQKILNHLGIKLSDLYDKYMIYKDFKTQNSYGVKTVNSIFYSNVSSLEISFFNARDDIYFKPIFNNGFEVKSYSYSSNYGYECNSVNTLSIIKGNETELFKRIFVKIEDMPKWSQDILYEIRKKELKKKEKTLKNKFKNFVSKRF